VFRQGISNIFRYGILARTSGDVFFEIFCPGTQRLAAYSLGPTSQARSHTAEETAEKIADPMSSLKIERGSIFRVYARSGGMTATRMIEVVLL